MKKSCLVILDANVVINAHEEKYWNVLVAGHKIYLPATVLRDEVQYFIDKDGKKIIDLSELISKGSIIELEATAEEDALLQSCVKPSFLPSLDPGEREALALLKGPRCKNYLFCSADGLAIKGLSILGMANQGISVEKLLNTVGHAKQLKNRFTEKRFKEHIAIGLQEKSLWLV